MDGASNTQDVDATGPRHDDLDREQDLRGMARTAVTMSEPPPQDDRRATERVDIELPARLHVGDDVIDAQTIDISHDAVLIGGDDFPSGSEVYIEIELAELGWQRLAADVVRRQDGGDGNVQLAAIFADAATMGGRDAISAFLKRHLG